MWNMQGWVGDLGVEDKSIGFKTRGHHACCLASAMDVSDSR